MPPTLSTLLTRSSTTARDTTCVHSHSAGFRSGGGPFTRSDSGIGDGRTPEEVADGFLRIAVENMANAIKKISVQRGYDVTEYALNCFGSAGGQHACQIADTLGMETVLIHPLSGLLSAYGMGLANIRASREQSVEAPLDAPSMENVAALSAKLHRPTAS